MSKTAKKQAAKPAKMGKHHQVFKLDKPMTFNEALERASKTTPKQAKE